MEVCDGHGGEQPDGEGQQRHEDVVEQVLEEEDQEGELEADGKGLGRREEEAGVSPASLHHLAAEEGEGPHGEAVEEEGRVHHEQDPVR